MKLKLAVAAPSIAMDPAPQNIILTNNLTEIDSETCMQATSHFNFMILQKKNITIHFFHRIESIVATLSSVFYMYCMQKKLYE